MDEAEARRILENLARNGEGWVRGEETPEGEFDADERAVKILGGKREQMIRALRLNAWTMKPVENASD